jgi:hypothetical protein
VPATTAIFRPRPRRRHGQIDNDDQLRLGRLGQTRGVLGEIMGLELAAGASADFVRLLPRPKERRTCGGRWSLDVSEFPGLAAADGVAALAAARLDRWSPRTPTAYVPCPSCQRVS